MCGPSRINLDDLLPAWHSGASTRGERVGVVLDLVE